MMSLKGYLTDSSSDIIFIFTNNTLMDLTITVTNHKDQAAQDRHYWQKTRQRSV